MNVTETVIQSEKEKRRKDDDEQSESISTAGVICRNTIVEGPWSIMLRGIKEYDTAVYWWISSKKVSRDTSVQGRMIEGNVELEDYQRRFCTVGPVFGAITFMIQYTTSKLCYLLINLKIHSNWAVSCFTMRRTRKKLGNISNQLQAWVVSQNNMASSRTFMHTQLAALPEIVFAHLSQFELTRSRASASYNPNSTLYTNKASYYTHFWWRRMRQSYKVFLKGVQWKMMSVCNEIWKYCWQDRKNLGSTQAENGLWSTSQSANDYWYVNSETYHSSL